MHMRQMAVLCWEKGHLLIIDEAYVDFAGFDHLSLAKEFENVLLVRSFSKGWGVAGARLALIIGSTRVIEYLKRYNPMNPVSGPSIAIVTQLLREYSQLCHAQGDVPSSTTPSTLEEELAEQTIRGRHHHLNNNTQL